MEQIKNPQWAAEAFKARTIRTENKISELAEINELNFQLIKKENKEIKAQLDAVLSNQVELQKQLDDLDMEDQNLEMKRQEWNGRQQQIINDHQRQMLYHQQMIQQ